MIFPITKPTALMLERVYASPGIRFTDLLKQSRVSSRTGNKTLDRLIASKIIMEKQEKSGKKMLERKFFPELSREEGFHCFCLVELDKKREFLEKIRGLKGPMEQLVRETEPEVVLVFGSFADGSFRAESDLDLMIISPRRENLKKVLELAFVTFPHPLSPRTESREDFRRNKKDSFHQTLIKNHIVIHGAEKFIKLAKVP